VAGAATTELVSPLTVRLGIMEAKIAEIEKRLDRIQAALAGRGQVDVASLRNEFLKAKARVVEALAKERPGKPAEVEQEAQELASTLVNIKMPAGIFHEGVSALVHVAAYAYFTQAFPTHPANLVIHGGTMSGGEEAIHIGSGTSVIADGVLIKDSAQDLAGIYWIRATFENVRVRYHGGPLYLADVTFKNCTFQFGNDPQSEQVRKALLGAEGKPTSLLLAGNFSSLRLRPNQ
jgi:hypothetical protein